MKRASKIRFAFCPSTAIRLRAQLASKAGLRKSPQNNGGFDVAQTFGLESFVRDPNEVDKFSGEPAVKAANASQRAEVFVLDDDRDVRDALRNILSSAGYQVVCFVDGRGLFEAIRQRTPDCILLDVSLPGQSGIEILKALASQAAPVIMVSGCGDIPTAVNAIKNGAIDFIEKPFRSQEILVRIEQALGSAGSKIKANQDASPQAKPSFLNFPGYETLTCREREVLEKITAGFSNKEAGRVLGISHRTVELHRARLLRKFGAKNSTAMLIAISKLMNPSK